VRRVRRQVARRDRGQSTIGIEVAVRRFLGRGRAEEDVQADAALRVCDPRPTVHLEIVDDGFQSGAERELAHLRREPASPRARSRRPPP
jgi:hypothetical protein